MTLLALIVFDQTTCSLYYQNVGSKHSDKINKDAKLITERLKALKSKVGERDKLQCEYGAWYVTRPEQEIVFAACVDGGYPERVAFGLIAKAYQSIKGVPQKTTEKKVAKCKNELNSLFKQYQNGGPDKVQEALKQTDLLKGELKKTVKHIMDNGERLDVLTEKSDRLKNYAMEFQRNADKVEKTLFWAKWRRCMIVGAIVALSLGVIGILFFLGAQ